ncbi:hypothetical protein D1AOALGA4SA_1315 [Olavius algarvensis Delta 1 endosymbiont]|nr:hypothetical protein D1AOALGA4SA_1315 [Olavius algarvensis Delta 1 endosymbiont]
MHYKILQGSTFIFHAVFGMASQEIEKRSQMAGMLQGMRALVVDDSATSQNIFKETLESFSLEVAIVETGEKAVDAVRNDAEQGNGYDLIIMDCIDRDLEFQNR